MKKFIYADNAATTKLDIVALKAMMPWLTEEYGNASQPYSFARKPKKALAEARYQIAKAINALPEEVFFTSGGTESDNWAIKGSMLFDLKKTEIITSSIEHHAILRACNATKPFGYRIIYIKPNSKGVIAPETIESNITDQTLLVSIMYSNNEIGTIEPIKELAQIAHKHGALFHTDAVQAIGHVKIDVQDLNVDMLSASAHKFNGPKGIGFLYIKKGIQIPSLLDGGAQENGRRAGTENIASIVGMAKALEENCLHMDEHTFHLQKLETELLSVLQESGLDYIRNGDIQHIPGSVSLSFKNADGEMLLHRLDLLGIAVSTGAACDSKKTQISHVLQAINLPIEYARGTIRISFGKNNTVEEAKIIGNSIKQILL